MARVYDIQGQAWPAECTADLIKVCQEMMADGVPISEHNVQVRAGFSLPYLRNHLETARDAAAVINREEFEKSTGKELRRHPDEFAEGLWTRRQILIVLLLVSLSWAAVFMAIGAALVLYGPFDF